MKSIGLFTLGLLIAAGMSVAPAVHAADPAKPPAENKEADKAAEAAGKAVPFQGKVSAVDAAARTFTLNGKTTARVFRVNDSTQILLNNQQSEFKAITVGEMVRGQAFKRADGWEAKKVMLGPKEEAVPKK